MREDQKKLAGIFLLQQVRGASGRGSKTKETWFAKLKNDFQLLSFNFQAVFFGIDQTVRNGKISSSNSKADDLAVRSIWRQQESLLKKPSYQFIAQEKEEAKLIEASSASLAGKVKPRTRVDLNPIFFFSGFF